MAPTAIRAAEDVRQRFDVRASLELFQSAGRENAGVHLVREPILLEIQGRFLSILDDGSMRALMGHELGHFIAHGPDSEHGAAGPLVASILGDASADPDLAEIASAYSMAREITADRFGVLATGVLDDVLRLEMVATTGLPAEALRADTEGYLAQCRELVDACLRGSEAARGVSHPEHGVRVWAAALFAESDLFRELTGKGPGSRPIADVDALIAKVLRRGSLTEFVRDTVEVTAEVHELALACAVLIGCSDGTLGDEETEILEKTFSSLVKDWRRLLEPRVAAERLHALAPIARAAGPSLQQPLFNLLLHVLLADGMADHREFSAIGDIGRALGCEEFFGFLLRSAVRRVAVDEREERSREPLPVKSFDAHEALNALLETARQRGTLRISLRRLLRLLGASPENTDARASAAASIQRLGLTVSPTLNEAGPDQMLVIEAPARASAPVVKTAPGADNLLRALQRLRDELISGDGHSPSIRMRSLRIGHSFDLLALEAISVGQAERVLALLSAGKPASLISGEAVGQSDAAARLVRNLIELRRENTSRIEESGARDLHLGTTFLCGAVDGYVVRAPLVLQAMTIDRASSEAGVRVAPTDDEVPAANQALLRTLFHKAGLPFKDTDGEAFDQLAANGAEGVTGMLDRLRAAGFDVFQVGTDPIPLDPLPESVNEWKGRRLEVQPCAVLGFFPQSNSELLEDYEQLLADLAAGRSPADLFASATPLLPNPEGASVDDHWKDRAVSVVPVIPADPSQVDVLSTARKERALVVDGPPGTGKSQVIANLVADCLARGERVAVVSEKRAALDVVANRLSSAGMGDALAVVHDVNEDRRALYQSIQKRLIASLPPEAVDPNVPPQPIAAPQAALLSSRETPASRLHVEQRLRGPIELLRRKTSDGVTLGQLACLASALRAPLTEGFPNLASLPHAETVRLAEVAAAAQSYRDLLSSYGPWRPSDGPANRKDFSHSTAQELEQLLHSLRAASAAAADCERHRSEARDPQACAQVLPTLEATLPLLKRPQPLPPKVLELIGVAAPEQIRALQALRQDWHAERATFASSPAAIVAPAPADLEPLAIRLAASAGSFLRFLKPSWWSGCGKLREHLARFWPERMGEAPTVPFLLQVASRARCALLWARLRELVEPLAARGAVPEEATAAAALLDAVSEHAETVLALVERRETLLSLGAWQLENPEAWLARVAALCDAAKAWSVWNERLAPCAAALHWLDAETPAETLAGIATWLERDAASLPALDRLLKKAEAIAPQGPLAVAACADAPDGVVWSALVKCAWATQRIKELKSGALTPKGDDVDDASARLAAVLVDESMARRAAVTDGLKRLPLLSEAAAAKGARRTPLQSARERLLKETAKQRRLLPLRTFVREYLEHGLFDVVPVWLLSPETLAVLFPRAPHFDVVIFDEASQCTVAGGFPALLRARRVVIAGDDKQMPPSSFFKAQREDEETSDTPEGAPADGLDAESLLALARRRFPARRLMWHYRCREEELIAFSNHAMYDGDLLTCPSRNTPASQPALRWIEVADARYEDGRNETEAARVVDLLKELLSRKPAPSVGVVTFNLSQRRAVLDAIDVRRATDAEFAQVIGEAEAREAVDDRPFVKNIENVQGDERDIIVFSLGHAPVLRKNSKRPDDWYVPARFGPIGQRGGERRLNVAVSRARAEIFVVSSFNPAQLSVARAKNDGPRLFRAYLDFARQLSSGSRVQAHRVLDQVRNATTGHRGVPSTSLPEAIPLVGQIAEALLDRKLPVAIRVGTSRFQLDLAIEEKDHRTRFKLAVLCDDGSDDDGVYRLTQRAALLRSRGWTILHVNALEWLEQREEVVKRIERALASTT